MAEPVQQQIRRQRDHRLVNRVEIARTAAWREAADRHDFERVALAFLRDNNWSSEAWELLRSLCADTRRQDAA